MTPPTDPGGGTAETFSLVGHNVKTLGIPLTATTYRLPKVSLKAQSTGYIDGDVTLYVDGDFSIVGGGDLTMLPNSSLTIYVSGDIDISGNGIANTGMSPLDLMIYGTGTTGGVKIAGTSAFFGAVYAPMLDIDIRGTSESYGSFVGETIGMTGGALVHFDECLGDSSGTGNATFNVAFWRID